MDDSGLINFENYLSGAGLDSNLINVKIENPPSPQISTSSMINSAGIEELSAPATAASITTSIKALQMPSLSLPSDLQNSAAESFQQLLQQSTYPTNYNNYYNTAPAMDNSVCEMTSTISPSNLINSVHHQLINHHMQQQHIPQQNNLQQQNLQLQQNNLQLQQNNLQQQQQQQFQAQQQQLQQTTQQILNSKPINLLYPTSTTTTTTSINPTTANHLFTTQPLIQTQGNGISLQNTTTRPIYIPPTLQTAGGQHMLNTLPTTTPLLQPQALFHDLSSTTGTTTDDLTSTYLLNNQQLLKSQQFTANSIINTSLLPLTQAQTVVLIGDVDITIEQQPPSDVRTRTPNDRRTFNCVIRVVGDYVKNNITTVLAQLAYANSHTERPSQDILGGNKVVPVGKDGKVVFDSLSMTEASTKHQENEFCLEYILLTDDNKRFILPNGTPFLKRSRPFYAYSNQKVLSRRRNVTLRTLSSNKGSTIGGDQMHVVGSPFIRCNSLRCIFHTPHGDIPANNIELYSESVLFFTLPSYPAPPNFSPPDGTELPVQVVITNDGRNYSNPLPFTYIFENGSTKRLRSRF